MYFLIILFRDPPKRSLTTTRTSSPIPAWTRSIGRISSDTSLTSLWPLWGSRATKVEIKMYCEKFKALLHKVSVKLCIQNFRVCRQFHKNEQNYVFQRIYNTFSLITDVIAQMFVIRTRSVFLWCDLVYYSCYSYIVTILKLFPMAKFQLINLLI